MATRKQLIKEIEQTPDFLIEEVLIFLLFIKIRLKQRIVEHQAFEQAGFVALPQ